MTTGERLRSLRGRKSLAVLGQELGVSATQLSKIETDQSKPSLELALKICDLYGVTLDWLFARSEEKNEQSTPAGKSGEITISLEEYAHLARKALQNEEKRNEDLQRQIDELKNT